MELDIISDTVDPVLIKSPEEEICLQKVLQLMEADVKMKSIRKSAQENLLLMAIRSYNCDADNAFRVLKTLQTCATETYPDLFSKVDLNKLKPVLDKKLFQVVKTTSPDHPAVLVFRTKRWKTSEVTADEILAAGMVYCYTMAANSIHIQKHGLVFIIDIDGFGFSHARQATYDLAMKIMHCITFANPVKILAYIGINSHMLFEKLYNVLKYCIPEKQRKFIYIVRKDLKPLYDLVPTKDLLPISLGGEVPDDLAYHEDVEEKIMQDSSLQKLITELQNEFPILKKK